MSQTAAPRRVDSPPRRYGDVVSLRLRDEDLARLDELATQRRRSRAAELRAAITMWLQVHEGENA